MLWPANPTTWRPGRTHYGYERTMKATFEFSLPEDTEEYEMYRRAPGFFGALKEFREWLRMRRQVQGADYGNMDRVWDKFHEVCEEFVNDL